MMKVKFLFRICLLLSALLGFYFGYQFYQRQFRLENITLLNQSEEQLLNEQEFNLIKTIIGQPFYYLDRGKQTFVFSSGDDKYVLKFFDTYQLNFEKSESAAHKMARLIAGYQLAIEQDREHTGIVFFTSKPVRGDDLTVELFDCFGLKHRVDLNRVPFVIQQKAIPTRELISKFLNAGNVETAKSHLKLILKMYLDEYQKGLYDGDHNFMYNTGFLNGKPIRIDLGRFVHDEAIKQPEKYMQDLRKIAIDRLGGWLGRHFPTYRELLLKEMQQYMLNSIDEQLL